MAGQEQVLPEAVRHPGGDRPGDEQPDDDVAHDRGPLHHEDVADRGVTVPAEQPPPEAAAGAVSRDAHVHGGVAFHGPGPPELGLPPGLLDQAVTHEQAERHGEQDDHDDSADVLRHRELPGDQQRQDDAQLDYQIGAGYIEDHGG